MVRLRNISVDTLHKGDTDDDNNNNNNNNIFLATHTDTSTLNHWDIIIIEVGE
jgi:hypothetical protein